MSLLTGGGALHLSTEVFENGDPSGLRARGFLSFDVLEPIPEPEPAPNNVSGLKFSKERFYFNQDFGVGDIEITGITFKNTPLFGANLLEALPSLSRRVETRQDFIVFQVSDPIPDPDPGPNNVSYISFHKSAAYGFRTLSPLPELSRNLKFGDTSALFIKTLGTIIAFNANGQVPIQMRRWDGSQWNVLSFKIWNGYEWV